MPSFSSENPIDPSFYHPRHPPLRSAGSFLTSSPLLIWQSVICHIFSSFPSSLFFFVSFYSSLILFFFFLPLKMQKRLSGMFSGTKNPFFRPRSSSRKSQESGKSPPGLDLLWIFFGSSLFSSFLSFLFSISLPHPLSHFPSSSFDWLAAETSKSMSAEDLKASFGKKFAVTVRLLLSSSLLSSSLLSPFSLFGAPLSPCHYHWHLYSSFPSLLILFHCYLHFPSPPLCLQFLFAVCLRRTWRWISHPVLKVRTLTGPNVGSKSPKMASKSLGLKKSVPLLFLADFRSEVKT